MGALLFSAPAIALAGNGSGGGGMAGARPATAATAAPAARQPRFAVAAVGTVTDASGGIEAVTGADPVQPAGATASTDGAAWLANQRAGGH